jgi:hypothetical protein
MAHTYNPSYSRGGDQEKTSSGKKFMRPPSQPIENAGVVVHVWHCSYSGSISRRIEVQEYPGIKRRPYLKNN